MLINVDINFKDNFSSYILRYILPPSKTADCQQIYQTVILKGSILEYHCFIKKGLNKKEVQLCNIFSILLFNELYLFV